MKTMRTALLPVAALFLSGCTAGITATKVKPGRNPKGMRVHLPAPFLVGRPNPAGTIDWKIEYLPDPDEEYAVHAWQLLAKNKSELGRTKSGLLNKAILTMDSTPVAKAGVDAAGAVGNLALETEVEKKKAAAAAAEEARKKAAMDAGDAARTSAKTKRQAVQEVEKARSDYQEALAGKRKADDAKAAADKKVADAKTAETAAAARATQARTEAATAPAADKAAKTKVAEEAEAAAITAREATAVAIGKAQEAAAEVAKEEESVSVHGEALDLAQREESIASDAFDKANAEKEKVAAVGNAAAVDIRTVTKAPGPVIYRILEDPATGGIRLEPMHFQVFGFNGEPTASFHQGAAGTWGTKKKADE
jgi:hypothetical protein